MARHTYHPGAVGLAACKRKAKDYAALKQTNYAFVPIAFEMPSGRLAEVSQQGLRRVLRQHGASDEMIRSVEAHLAAAVLRAQGVYIGERVAIHLSQKRARSGRRRRRQAKARRYQGRDQQAVGVRAVVSRGEGQHVLPNEARSLGSVQSSSEVQALSGAEGVSAASAVGSVQRSRVDRLQNRNYQSRQPAEPNASLQVGGAELPAEQVLQNEARSLGSVQSSGEVQALSGAGGVSATSAVGSVQRSRVDRLQNRNYQSRQPAEPNASLQLGGAELPAEQVALTAEGASTEPASAALSAPQSVGSATTDGSLVTFVVPEVPSGSLLRLRLDGADLPVAVKVPPRVCKGDIITGRVRGGSLSITKIEMAGCEGSGGGVGQ